MNLFIAGVGNVELFKGKNEDKIQVERGSDLAADYGRIPLGAELTKIVIKRPESESESGRTFTFNKGSSGSQTLWGDTLMSHTITEWKEGQYIVLDFENNEAYYQDAVTLKRLEDYQFDFDTYNTIKDEVVYVVNTIVFFQ